MSASNFLPPWLNSMSYTSLPSSFSLLDLSIFARGNLVVRALSTFGGMWVLACADVLDTTAPSLWPTLTIAVACACGPNSRAITEAAHDRMADLVLTSQASLP